ncbi:MAG: SPOR domain-containing protein [Pseudomonadota bacterium]
MAQDFAKQSKKRPEVERRKPARAATRVIVKEQRNYWSWYFSGLLSGVIVAIIGYFGILHIETQQAEAAQTAQAIDPANAEPPAFSFGFYENLKNAEISVAQPAPAPEVITEATPPAASASSPAVNSAVATTSPVAEPNRVSYLLQAGSFQNREDAENRRAEIMLQGMIVNVVPGVVSGRNLFRVQVGPMEERQKAESAREVLSTLNIESILLVVR